MADPRFKNIEIKVGIFVLFAIATLVAVIIAIGISRDIFVKKIYVQVYTNTGEDVSKGMPVKYSGFQITRVDDVQLQDDGQVVMRIGIPTRYTKWIRKDSVFKLGAQNIIGSGFIAIQTDLKSESPRIVNGESFKLVRDQGLQAMIEQAMPVIEDLKEIVSSVNIILARFAEKDGDFNKLMQGLGSLGYDISNKEGSLGYLTRTDFVQKEIAKFLQDLKEFSETAVQVAKNVERGSLTLDHTLKTFDDKSGPIVEGSLTIVRDVTDIAQALKPALERLEPIMAQLELTAKNTASGTENLDELRAEIQSIVQTGNELLLKIQNTWPLSMDKTPDKVPLQ